MVLRSRIHPCMSLMTWVSPSDDKEGRSRAALSLVLGVDGHDK